MASETYIISKELSGIPDDIEFEITRRTYYFKFYSDFGEMQNFLSMCKVSVNIHNIYLSCSSPLIELIHQLGMKIYLIEYENDFAGQPDDSGFIIPVSNGIILNKLIVDESNADFGAFKRAYKAVGLDYP